MSTHQSTLGQGETSGQSRQTRTYRTAVDLPAETRENVVGMLNATLADTTDLMTQAKVAHWNVKGMHFYQLHLLFDEIAETLEDHVDVVAERTTALGGEATGTVRDAARTTRIPEMPADATTGPEYVAALVERVGVHANTLRRDIEVAVEYGDEDTADMYTELSREVDKQLYFLEAHLQATDPGAIPRSPGGSSGERTASQGANPSQYRQRSQSGSQMRSSAGQQAQGQQTGSGGQQAGSSSQQAGSSGRQTQGGGRFQRRGTAQSRRSYGRRHGY